MKFKNRIKISNKWVGGKNDPCFIIAEAGSNHNRDFNTAKKLIDSAFDAGADAVKFQTYSAETLYQESKEPLRLIGEKEKPFDIIKRIEIPRHWHKDLADYARRKGIIFMSTPFDRQAIDELDKFVPAFKWGSPELLDKPLLEYVASKHKPLIISTGFYGMDEIKNALSWVYKNGNRQVVLLQCTGMYPTFPEEVNLLAMKNMAEKFQLPVGFSDHTLGVLASVLSVVAGAKVIEKHFTLDKKMDGPDHAFALEPSELKEMIENIRLAEKMMGSETKKATLREVRKEKLIRRGVVAFSDIKKGEVFSEKNIITKRTGSGPLAASDFAKLLGRKAKTGIKKDQAVYPKNV